MTTVKHKAMVEMNVSLCLTPVLLLMLMYLKIKTTFFGGGCGETAV